MEIIEEIRLDCICCICLQEKTQLHEIFDEAFVQDELTIAKMLTKYAHFRIHEDDGLPHNICTDCMMDTYRVHDFMQKTANAYCQLVEMLSEAGGGEEHEMMYNSKSTQTDKFSIHPCEVCGEKYFDIYDLREHRLKTHSDDGGGKQCRVCKQTFPDMRHLRSHLVKAHPNSGLTFELQCPVCYKSFTRKYQMKKHILHMHQEEEVEVAQESINYKKESVVETFINSTHWSDADDANVDASDDDESAMMVTEEKQESNTAESLKVETEHLIEETSDYSQQNDIQIDTFEESNMMQDADNASNDKNFMQQEEYLDDVEIDCDDDDDNNDNEESINEEFTNANMPKTQSEDGNAPIIKNVKIIRECRLKKHVRKPYGSKSLNSNQPAVQQSDNNNSDDNYKCSYCNKIFLNEIYVRKHELLHTQLVFACKFCEATFKDSKLFRQHEREHRNKERNYLCSHCGANFKRYDHFVVHMRRHTGERPFKCQYCDRTFVRTTDVRMHERYHTDERSHVCKICNKSFHNTGNLNGHMRIHTGERPYKCDQCTKDFTQLNDLTSHKHRHTGTRYGCSECSMSFCKLYTLHRHSLRVHNLKIALTKVHVKKIAENLTTNEATT